MTREIKFRAWSNRDRCWIEAFSIHKTGLFSECINAHIEEPQHIAIADAHWQDLSIQDDIMLMQFTGLYDKNGKEIYEEDVIEYTFADTTLAIKKVNLPIIFTGGAFAIELLNNEPVYLRESITLSNRSANGIEVIGNIYQNPELIK